MRRRGKVESADRNTYDFRTKSHTGIGNHHRTFYASGRYQWQSRRVNKRALNCFEKDISGKGPQQTSKNEHITFISLNGPPMELGNNRDYDKWFRNFSSP